MRESDILESKPLVGSSSNSREGLPNRDRATFVRFLSLSGDSAHEAGRTHDGVCALLQVELLDHAFHLTFAKRERESEAKRTLQHSAALSFCS